jgi:hypothetical protein
VGQLGEAEHVYIPLEYQREQKWLPFEIGHQNRFATIDAMDVTQHMA